MFYLDLQAAPRECVAALVYQAAGAQYRAFPVDETCSAAKPVLQQHQFYQVAMFVSSLYRHEQ